MRIDNLILKHKYYSLLQLSKLNVFPWITSYDSLKRWVKKDIANGNKTFHAVLHGKGNGKRYLIKGSTVYTLLRRASKGQLILTNNNHGK
jgi:hypothetical protein